jgi:hypothetical protein
MDHVDGTGQPVAQERSTGELVKQAAEQISVLVRDELKLARLEMSRKGKQAGSGIGIMGGGGLIALYGVGCLIACAIIAISHPVPAWLAALIIGEALLAVATVVTLAGKARMKSRPPPAPEARAAGGRRATTLGEVDGERTREDGLD